MNKLLASGASKHRRIILHCDINRTLIQIDPAGGKTLSDVLNANIADRVLGQLNRDEKMWHVLPEASPHSFDVDATKRAPDHVTYSDFIDNVLFPKPAEMNSLSPADASALWATVSANRRAAKHVFTEPGQPGERFRDHWHTLDRAMKAPTDETWFIIPSFFHMVNTLSVAEWPFSVVFRTFGHDLDDVMREWCQFISGEHPHFTPQGPLLERAKQALAAARAATPGVAFPPSWIPKGNVYRNATGTYLVYGDDSMPPKAHEDGVAVYTARGFTPRRVSDVELAHHIVEACESQGADNMSTFGLVDYYPWWAAHGEHRSAGKVFPVLLGDSAPYQIFFDDNVHHDGGQRSIVDFRCFASTASGSHPVDGDGRGFMVSVDPWEAILNPHYFLDQLVVALQSQSR